MRIIAPGDQRQRHPGAFYIVFNKRYGTFHARSWPRKRATISAKTQKQNETFKTVMALVRRAAGADRVAAGEYVKNMPFLPQDALVSAAYGTLFETVRIGGKLHMSARIAQEQVELLLDSISSIPGSILYRAADEWVALLPGSDNQVLTINAATGVPDWEDAQGGGGGSGAGLLLSPPITGEAGDDYASVGYWFTASQDVKVTKYGGLVKAAAGLTYTSSIAPYDPSTKKITADARVSAAVAYTEAADYQQFWHDLSPAVAISAGETYAVWVSRTDGSGTAEQASYYGTSTLPISTYGIVVPETQGIKAAVSAPGQSDGWTPASAWWSVWLIVEPSGG